MSKNSLFTLALVAGLMLIGADAFAAADSTAAGAGQTVLTSIQGAITGNLGLVLGLGLAILGIWTWVVKQETGAGIFLIIGGVLITIAPGVFNTIGSFVAPIVRQASGYAVDSAQTGKVLSGQ